MDCRRWRHGRRRAVTPIIGTILLLAITIVALTIVFSFKVYTPPTPPSAGFTFRSGGSNPVWGDPTDCQPQGNWTYPLPSSEYRYWVSGTWGAEWLAQCYPYNIYTGQPQIPTGNFSGLNSSQIVISQVSSNDIPLSEVGFTFVCNNASSSGGTTVLLAGSLASMTWFPGSSISPAPNAPTLGYCGNFNASGFGGGAFGTLYNRLGLFIPLVNTSSTLQAGDTFILYIHNGGWPLDYQCVDPYIYGCFLNHGKPILDNDDYHGAPPWCFDNPGACTIYLTYSGHPNALLAKIPVFSLAPPTT